MKTARDLLGASFGTLPELIRAQARERPHHAALVQRERSLDYACLDALSDRIAAALQRDGLGQGAVVAICAAASIEYAAAFVGILRAGAAVAPLAPSSTPESLAAMLRDCDARLLFLDPAFQEALEQAPVAKVAFDGECFEAWLAAPGSSPAAVAIRPSDPFNIIYSSGTTGTPKGIVQSHAMRWPHLSVGELYTRDAVTLVSTPLYSNTTLVSFLPTLANGGTVVLLPKFDPAEFLALSERHRVTHAMLVPVQYRRLLEHPEFDAHDLSSYTLKFSTSAPFSAALKAEVLRRWPGGLIEFYGTTEGGGSCGLFAHEHPDKLDTVGQPLPGHDVRVIDEWGAELPPGSVGEVVGRSPAMMTGYHKQAKKTAEAEWISPDGLRFIRTGDLGAFDADGFLTLLDRKKDMIISGGFNIFPSDIEAELLRHPIVTGAAVVGIPSDRWGETPVGFAVLGAGESIAAADLLDWVNQRLGKTQRLSDLRLVPSLPRSAIGKVLKRTLRDGYLSGAHK